MTRRRGQRRLAVDGCGERMGGGVDGGEFVGHGVDLCEEDVRHDARRKGGCGWYSTGTVSHCAALSCPKTKETIGTTKW